VGFFYLCFLLVFNKELFFPSLENCFRDRSEVALLSEAFLTTQFRHTLCSMEVLEPVLDVPACTKTISHYNWLIVL